MKVKINTVVGNDYSVTFELDDGTKIEQKINVPFIEKEEDLKAFFLDYISAYLKGKEVENKEKEVEIENKKREGITIVL